MNLREAFNIAKPVVVEEEIAHDEVVEFLKRKKLDSRPVLLNVEGRKVAKNFVCSRSLLASYLKIDEYSLAPKLAEIEAVEPKIEFRDFSELGLKKRKVDLLNLPIIKYYPNDGSRYVTASIVIAERGGKYNASFHRLMLLDSKSFAARLVPPRHTYLMWRDAIESGEELDVAICIGNHPLFMFAAASRVENEFEYASKLLNRLVLYKKGNFLIPDSEIVLLGKITSDIVDEGPFVDITGTYDIVRKEPIVEIKEMFCKEDFIYYSITPGGSEHQVLMGIPYEPVIYNSVSKVCRVKNVVMTPGSRYYFHAIVQIEKRTEGDAKNAILAALAANPSMKGVIIVDDDIDILSYEDVEYAIATRFQADKDLIIVSGARGSSLDPSAGKTTAKWGIDATKTLEESDKFKRVV